jgi:hypothetical protein
VPAVEAVYVQVTVEPDGVHVAPLTAEYVPPDVVDDSRL